jgi:hypothetical protein
VPKPADRFTFRTEARARATMTMMPPTNGRADPVLLNLGGGLRITKPRSGFLYTQG